MAIVAAGAATGNVVVTVGGVASNGYPFTVGTAPTITGLSPTVGPVNTLISISGANFGSSVGTSTITLNGVAAPIIAWTPTLIGVRVPSGAATGPVVITVGGVPSNSVAFTVAAAPVVTSATPASGAAGRQVTVTGTGFGSTRGSGMVWLGSTLGMVVSWSDTQIVAVVASNAQTGTAQVRQNGMWSNSPVLSVTTATVTNVSPTSGPPGTVVTVTGSGFGTSQGSGQIWLGTAYGVVQSWTDTQIVATVAPGAPFGSAQSQSQSMQSRLRSGERERLRKGGLRSRGPQRPVDHATVQPAEVGGSGSGNIQVLQHGVSSNSWPFTVNALHIASISPTSAAPGTSVIITGTGFGALQGSGAVWLGSLAGQVLSWTDTQIVATVTAGSLTGMGRVQQSGTWSNALTLTMTGNTTLLKPNLVTLGIGDTATVQATGLNGQPLITLTWTSSNPAIVSLSTDNPPILTGQAVGHATVIAGTASIDVLVLPPDTLTGTLPTGTVIWSNPFMLT